MAAFTFIWRWTNRCLLTLVQLGNFSIRIQKFDFPNGSGFKFLFAQMTFSLLPGLQMQKLE